MPEAFDATRERQILAWFEASHALPKEDRKRFLQDLDSRDPDGRARVEQLLARCDAEATLPELHIREAVGAASQSVSSPLPERIGSYVITRRVGKGGMGEVFEAEQEDPKRLVALKVMNEGLQSESAIQRFRYESQLLGQLHHPGIARVYEAGVHVERWGLAERQIPFFAMEYVTGGRSLTQYAADEQLDARRRIRLLIETCRAVAAGHEQLIIHRDLKPGNVLVGSDGKIKVIDFGVARQVGPDTARGIETAPGFVIGTPMYMSPEQFSDELGAVGVRSDVYSLGVLAYELLSGQHPFQHLKDRPVGEWPLGDVAHAVLTARPAKLTSLERGASAELGWVLDKALRRSPDERYGSASDLADDFERFLANEAVMAGPPSSLYRLRKFARRNRLAVVGGTAIALMLAVGGVWILSAKIENDLLSRTFREQQLPELFDNVFRTHGIETAWRQRGSEILDMESLLAGRPQPSASALAQQSLSLIEAKLTIYADYDIPLDGSIESDEVARRINAVYARQPGSGQALWDGLSGLLFTLKAWGFMGAVVSLDSQAPEWASSDQLARWSKIGAEQPGGVALMRLVQDCLPLVPDRQMGKAWRLFVQNYSSSWDWLNDIENEMSRSANHLAWLGAVRTMVDGEESAGRHFRSAIELDPTLLVARFSLAHYYGNPEFAEHDPAEAALHFTACLSRVGDWTDAWNGLATAEARLGRTEEAENHARRALENVRFRTSSASGAWTNVGWAHMQSGRLGEAIESFDMALSIQASNSVARSNRATVLGKLGRHDEGLAEFDRVERDNPDYVKVHNKRGQLLLLAKRYAPALAAFDRAIELGKESASIQSNAGVCLHKLGRPQEEEQRYRRAIELDPDGVDGHRNLALLLHSTGRMREAIPFYERTLELEPTDVQRRANLANIHLEFEEWAQAEEHFVFLSELHPVDPIWHLRTGLTRQSAGNSAGALPALDAARGLAPKSVWVRFSQVHSLLHAREHERALTELRDAVEMVRVAVAEGDPNADKKCGRMKTMLEKLRATEWEMDPPVRARLSDLEQSMEALLRERADEK
ncbi:MAG: protein kinase [bacterium]|nr:protein kinase [bacterium]